MRVQGAKFLLLTASAVFILAATGRAQSPVDPTLPVYQRVDGLKGTIVLTGSDTMSQVAARWADGFRQLYPEVEVRVEVQGARAAVTSVQTGAATFGLLSRQITEQEVKGFYDAKGYVPTVLTPALDPLGVFVHKDNPITGLSLAQLDAIFSTSLKRGAPKTAQTWGELGLGGQWGQLPIVCQIHMPDGGSQMFFQSAVLGGGQFRTDAIVNKSNLDLVKSIAADPRSIGFTGASFASPDIKAVPIAWRDGEPGIDVHTNGYPLVRPLQVVVNNPPQGQMPLLQTEFIKFIFSARGQQDVVISGFLPVPSRVALQSINAVGGAVLN